MCQARFQVLHRPHLNPWTCAFWPSVTHSADYLRQFHFPSVFVDPVSVSLFVLVVTLNDYSHDSVDPRMLNLHLSPELPEAGSAELWKEVQQVLAAGWHAEMNAEGTRSRDLDLLSLLERPLCSAAGGGPADADDGFITVKSSSDTSSDSGVPTG